MKPSLQISSALMAARDCGSRWLPLLAAFATAWMLPAAEPPGNLTSVELIKVGFIRSSFLNVNQADAESAFQVLGKTVGNQRGYRAATETRIFETTTEIEAGVKTGTVNLAIVDAWKFVSMDSAGYMTPYFVTSEEGQAAKKYLLLTRRNGGLNTLAQLRGRNIIELEVANSNVGRAWLDTLLLENHFGVQTDFFGAVTFASKPSLTVLPVFFGKFDACLVDQLSFELMGELNPQVRQAFQVVATSEPYVENVVCLSISGWPSEKGRQDMIEVLADLHKDPPGQQILTLFRIGPLVPFQNGQLDSVRQLRSHYEQLLKNRQPPAGTSSNLPTPTPNNR